MLAESAGLAERIRDGGFREPPISFEHAIAVGRNPRIHRDPFDRMLIAQARCEELTLLTSGVLPVEVAGCRRHQHRSAAPFHLQPGEPSVTIIVWAEG